MRLFSAFAKSELLCSRSSRSSRSSGCFFFHALLDNFLTAFFLLYGFLYFFLLGFHFTGRGDSGRLSLNVRLHVSCEYYCGEGNGNEGGYDCGQNFFHLYYLQRNVFDLVIADGVPKAITSITICFLTIFYGCLFHHPEIATPYTTCNTLYAVKRRVILHGQRFKVQNGP